MTYNTNFGFKLDQGSGLILPPGLANRKITMREGWEKRWQLAQRLPNGFPLMEGGRAIFVVRGTLGVIVAWEPFLAQDALGYHLCILGSEGRTVTNDEVWRARWDLLPHEVAMYEVHPPQRYYEKPQAGARHLFETRAPGVVALCDRFAVRKGAGR